MRFFCTIYNRDNTFGTENKNGIGRATEPDGGTGPNHPAHATDGLGFLVVAGVAVAGKDRRQAAARAYVRFVGRERSRLLREQLGAPPRIAAQETNPAAIAASLRKLDGPQGEGYELDNLVESWFITVDPALALLPGDRRPSLPFSARPPRRLRIPLPQRYRLLRSPSPN